MCLSCLAVTSITRLTSPQRPRATAQVDRESQRASEIVPYIITSRDWVAVRVACVLTGTGDERKPSRQQHLLTATRQPMSMKPKTKTRRGASSTASRPTASAQSSKSTMPKYAKALTTTNRKAMLIVMLYLLSGQGACEEPRQKKVHDARDGATPRSAPGAQSWCPRARRALCQPPITRVQGVGGAHCVGSNPLSSSAAGVGVAGVKSTAAAGAASSAFSSAFSPAASSMRSLWSLRTPHVVSLSAPLWSAKEPAR